MNFFVEKMVYFAHVPQLDVSFIALPFTPALLKVCFSALALPLHFALS
jgi:hypothetical protein